MQLDAIVELSVDKNFLMMVVGEITPAQCVVRVGIHRETLEP
jgi:hypothetical protein